jgi:hypothetical protein
MKAMIPTPGRDIYVVNADGSRQRNLTGRH